MSPRAAAIYVAIWVAVLIQAAVTLALRRSSYALVRPEYWRFLFRPWKLVTFVLATAGLTGIAPYTGDPTWDRVDAPLMAGLTFASAPWTVGVVYRVLARRLEARQLGVALPAWMLSASWSYDGWLLLRDGRYPPSFLFNLVASSLFYVLAGLFWSLEFLPGRGVTFAFLEKDWPAASAIGSFTRVAKWALAFMALAGGMVLWFAG